MALHSALVSIVVAAALFSTSSAALGGRKGSITGGWTPIPDPIPPNVVDVGKFAINAHNKAANTTLQFKSVIKGEKQVVSGMNYKLVIAAKDGSAEKKYEAIVWDRSWLALRNLTSFKPYEGASNP